MNGTAHILQSAGSHDLDLDRSELKGNFDRMRSASRGAPPAELRERRALLRKLKSLLEMAEPAFIEAVSDDFGWRAPGETRFADISIVLGAIDHALRHLPRWMRAERVKMPRNHWPASGRIERQPLGVVGIIGPWNYPLQLTLVPAISALAAGNHVLVKPSEHCPRTSALLAKLVNENFANDRFVVHLGDADFSRVFASLPFDHLFFTGSTAVGREIAKAAATNLTPVTLELGGKSPALIASDADLDWAAKAVAWGKFLNGGQTCVAPDYVLIAASQRDAFVQKLSAAVASIFPEWWSSGDYSSIVSDRHATRLQALVDDAIDGGGTRIALGQQPEVGDARRSSRMMQPTAIIDPPANALICNEEIFGPILPIIAVPDDQAALDYIVKRPRPLALYVFTREQAMIDACLKRCVVGGMLVNDAIWHVAVETMPFGGVGESGMGAYHGEDGFLTFTKRTPVYNQSRWTGTHMMRPPYGSRFNKMVDLLRKLPLS
jgi:coniferyl-aldehyde dehydrogenase